MAQGAGKTLVHFQSLTFSLQVVLNKFIFGHLKHLGLWEVKPRPPPKATGPAKTPEHTIDYSTSQLPASDKWLYVDPEYPEETHST